MKKANLWSSGANQIVAAEVRVNASSFHPRNSATTVHYICRLGRSESRVQWNEVWKGRRAARLVPSLCIRFVVQMPPERRLLLLLLMNSWQVTSLHRRSDPRLHVLLQYRPRDDIRLQQVAVKRCSSIRYCVPLLLCLVGSRLFHRYRPSFGRLRRNCLLEKWLRQTQRLRERCRLQRKRAAVWCLRGRRRRQRLMEMRLRRNGHRLVEIWSWNVDRFVELHLWLFLDVVAKNVQTWRWCRKLP